MENNIPKKGTSFWLNKSRTNTNKLLPSLVGEQEDVNEEVDYVVSLDDKAIKSTKHVEKGEELVIPLITTNRWRLAKRPDELEQDQEDVSDFIITEVKQEVVSGDSATDQAVHELLRDAAADNSSAGVDSTLSVPLLLRNKVPDGFETDERMDVSLRPDQASDADYEAVPIEQYGKALLRGMGWKDGDGIGKKNRIVGETKNKKKKKIGSGSQFECPICQAKLTRAHSVKVHMVQVHGKISDYINARQQQYSVDEIDLRPATDEDRDYYYSGKKKNIHMLKKKRQTKTNASILKTKTWKKKGSRAVKYKGVSKVETSDEVVTGVNGSAGADVKTSSSKKTNGSRVVGPKSVSKIELSDEAVPLVNGPPRRIMKTSGKKKKKKGSHVVKSKAVSKIERSHEIASGVNGPPGTIMKTSGKSNKNGRVLAKVESSEETALDVNGTPVVDAKSVHTRYLSVTPKCRSSKNSAVCTVKLDDVSGKTLTKVSETSGPSKIIKWTVLDKSVQGIVESSLDSSLQASARKVAAVDSSRTTTRSSSRISGNFGDNYQCLSNDATPKKRKYPEHHVASEGSKGSVSASIAEITSSAPNVKRSKRDGTSELSNHTFSASNAEMTSPSGHYTRRSKHLVTSEKSNDAVSASIAEITSPSVHNTRRSKQHVFSQESNSEVSTLVAQTTSSSSSVPNSKPSNGNIELNGSDFKMLGTMSRLVSLTREFPPPWNSNQLLDKAREIFPEVEVSTLKMTILGIVTASRMCATGIMSSSLRETLRESRLAPTTRCDKVHLDEQLTQSYIDSI